MRTMLIGRKHGETNWQVIMGPESHTADHVEARQSMLDGHPVNEVWAEVELWQEDLVKSKTRFLTSDEFKREAKLRKANDKAFEKSRSEAEERTKKQEAETELEARKKHEEEVARLNKQHSEFSQALRPRK